MREETEALGRGSEEEEDELSDERLRRAVAVYAAARLASLPDPEECQWEPSPRFRRQIRRMMRRVARRERWRTPRFRAALTAAALAVMLAAGFTVGAGQRADCQVYWSQTEGQLSYAVRVEHSTVPVFRRAALDHLPEGYVLEKETGGEERVYIASYRDPETDGWFRLTQKSAKKSSGLLLGDYTAQEAEIGGRVGVLIESVEDGVRTLLWADGPYILTLDSAGVDQEELLKIAEGIRW